MQNPERAAAISREFHNFLADIESLLKETAALTGEELSHAKAKMQVRVEAAKESASRLSDNVNQRAATAATSVNEEVHAEPWKAIGIAGAVGLMLGILLTRR